MKTKKKSLAAKKKSQSTPKKKKRSRRSTSKYPALEKKYSLKTRGDLIDYDYIHKLSPKEKQWLNDFTNEEIHAAVKSGSVERRKENRFNKSKKATSKIYAANNARNACIWTKEKAKGMGQYLEEFKETLLTNNPEDYLIEKMDLEQDGWVDNEGNIILTENEFNDIMLVATDPKVNKKKLLTS